MDRKKNRLILLTYEVLSPSYERTFALLVVFTRLGIIEHAVSITAMACSTRCAQEWITCSVADLVPTGVSKLKLVSYNGALLYWTWWFHLCGNTADFEEMVTPLWKLKVMNSPQNSQNGAHTGLQGHNSVPTTQNIVWKVPWYQLLVELLTFKIRVEVLYNYGRGSFWLESLSLPYGKHLNNNSDIHSHLKCLSTAEFFSVGRVKSCKQLNTSAQLGLNTRLSIVQPSPENVTDK